MRLSRRYRATQLDDELSWMTRLRSFCAWALAALLVTQFPLSGCLVKGDRCDQNEMISPSNPGVCVCVEGTVPDPRGYGCVRCQKNEEPANGICQCTLGFERKTSSAPCEASAGGVPGAACDDATPCANPYPYCASWEGESFCTTQDCSTQSGCPSKWRCEQAQGERFCARPPAGLEKTCAAADDCKDTEAKYCDTIFTQKCYVDKCATAENVCPSSYSCCDLAALIGNSICVPTMLLENDMCPDGKAPVSP